MFFFFLANYTLILLGLAKYGMLQILLIRAYLIYNLIFDDAIFEEIVSKSLVFKFFSFYINSLMKTRAWFNYSSGYSPGNFKLRLGNIQWQRKFYNDNAQKLKKNQYKTRKQITESPEV